MTIGLIGSMTNRRDGCYTMTETRYTIRSRMRMIAARTGCCTIRSRIRLMTTDSTDWSMRGRMSYCSTRSKSTTARMKTGRKMIGRMRTGWSN